MAKKLRHGQARVQFLACRAEICDLIEKGHSIKCVHEILIEDNKITMSYTALTSFLKKYEKPECKKDKIPQEIIIVEKNKQPNKILVASANNEQFGKIKTDLKELI